MFRGLVGCRWLLSVTGRRCVGGAAGDLDPGEPTVVGLLIAPDRGFLVWTPVVLCLAPAVWRARKAIPAWSMWLALGGLGYTLVQLRMNPFGGGDFFYGYRLGLELLTCITPLVAFALPWTGRTGRVLASIAVSVQFGAILVGASAERYFVKWGHVWRDNSFAMAVRERPVAMTTWMALCIVLGFLGSYLAKRWADEPAESGLEYRRQFEAVD